MTEKIHETLGEGALWQRRFWEYNIPSGQGLTGTWIICTAITSGIGASSGRPYWIWNALSRRVLRLDAPCGLLGSFPPFYT